jgi:hypothetical protein
VRRLEVRRLALAIRDAEDVLADDKEQLAALVAELFPALPDRVGVGPVSAAHRGGYSSSSLTMSASTPSTISSARCRGRTIGCKSMVALCGTRRRTGYVWPSELDVMAQLAGLRLRERWANWTRSPFTSDSADQVAVFEKLP